MPPTEIPTIQKQQFRNETGGWIGAVVLNAKGEETGVAVAAGETIWLSRAEQILTANAPRDPKDNPFIAQTYVYMDQETGDKKEGTVTPLVPISENRFVPASERPIPAEMADGAAGAAQAEAAATGEEPEVPVAEGDTAASREEAVTSAPQPPPRAAAAAAAAQPPGEPTHPAQELPVGALPPQEVPPTPGAEEEQATPDTGLGSPTEGEETAVQSPGPAHEETGAALPPAGPPPEGAWASGEEVGTPEAPSQQPPAPLPPSEG